MARKYSSSIANVPALETDSKAVDLTDKESVRRAIKESRLDRDIFEDLFNESLEE